MEKSKSISEEKSLWIPINLWNLNEVFTTESISPISFYEERNFGNPFNRNQEAIEDINNLILFDDLIQSSILLKISNTLLDINCLTEIKTNKSNLKSYEYSKTIYLKKGYFNVYFTSQEKLNEFLNNAFMLLEVKTTNKYKSDFRVIESIPKKNGFYQTQLISDKTPFQPFFDKAINQIKGLIYGYLIGSLGTLDQKEQNLISDLSKLKNTIGSIHTDIVLSEHYSAGSWLINIRKQIKDCQKSYFENFCEHTDVLDTLLMRLEEIDNLNKMRCEELSKQKSPDYKRNFEKEQDALEKTKQALYQYEYTHKITFLKEEVEKIKQEEKRNGELKGKAREYFKIGSEEYDRKNELKQIILKLEDNEEYQNLKKEANIKEERLRNFQFGYTQFDTSITEQFSRISENLHEITKKTNNDFLSKNNKSNIFPDISFEINTSKLSQFYFGCTKEYREFSIVFPKALSKSLNETELQLLGIAVNSIFSKPQGQLGNFSEQDILEIIKDIGENLPENSFKQILRDYYRYRIGKNDSFTFPDNSVLANVIVFLMKLNGHDQINKMLITKNIPNRQIAFLLYGAYLGFANMPKTFTNIVFDSDNTELFSYLDNYLFNNFLIQKL